MIENANPCFREQTIGIRRDFVLDIIYRLPVELQSRLNMPYRVKGSFYKLRVDGREFNCRNVLEISSADYETHDALPDAIAVMMNPGSSKPALDETEMDTFDSSSIFNLPNNEMVPAVPDPTQSQFMRLMLLLGWQYVRILNLSDIRDSDSSSFLKKLTRLRQAGRYEHSVFCEARREELKLLLRRKKSAPIVVGWGKDHRLVSLANMAISYLREHHGEPIGLSEEHGSVLYRHPSIPNNPYKNAEWLEHVICAVIGIID